MVIKTTVKFPSSFSYNVAVLETSRQLNDHYIMVEWCLAYPMM